MDETIGEAGPGELLPVEESPETDSGGARTPAVATSSPAARDLPDPGPGPAPGAPEADAAGGEVADPGTLSFHAPARRNDGSVELVFSADGNAVLGTFFPSLEEGQPIDRDYVDVLLQRMGVVAGISKESIDAAVLEANLERRIVREVLVARAEDPVEEVPEHADLEPRFARKGPLVGAEVLHADYRELSSLLVVKKGETLATVRERIPGREGRDLRGKTTSPGKRQVGTCLAGKNVVAEPGRLAAAVDGLLTVSGEGQARKLDVDEVFLVRGAVDYHTGHIVFPGDVVIEGRIGDGFKVWSGGSILCKSTMDAYDVNAKKDLVCKEGIIGKRRAQVRVGGALSAKFIQNCRLAVRGDAHIASAMVNCHAFVLGRLDLGEKGVLTGGETYAVHGMRCGRIGNAARQRTLVNVGTDFALKQKLERANERLRLLADSERRAKEAAKANPGPRADRVVAEIWETQAKLRLLVGDLIGGLDVDEEASVEVRGEIFPGTVIEICRVSVVVEEPLKSCRFRLDKVAGRIVVEKLGAKSDPAPAKGP